MPATFYTKKEISTMYNMFEILLINFKELTFEIKESLDYTIYDVNNNTFVITENKYNEIKQLTNTIDKKFIDLFLNLQELNLLNSLVIRKNEENFEESFFNKLDKFLYEFKESLIKENIDYYRNFYIKQFNEEKYEYTENELENISLEKTKESINNMFRITRQNYDSFFEESENNI